MDDIIEKLRKGEMGKEEFQAEYEKRIEAKKTASLTFNDLATVEKAFGIVFPNSAYVLSKIVKDGGGTSCNVYVPKKFAGFPATIIIWNKGKLEDIKVLVDGKV